jgi:LysR family nitrogen assimilation transcriptional regulator
LDLRQLRYFREVANAQNFRAAAQRLNISQSSLSRRVADLEASLGVTLLHRDARGVKLTVPGHTLLARADALLDQFANLEKDIAGDSRLSGRVTVGTSDPVSRLLLAPLAATFEGPQNGIQLSFVEGAQYVLFEGLEAGRVDLAVMTTPEPIATCKMDPILLEPLHFITRYADRPKRKPISIVEVASHPLIMFPRPSGNRNYLEQKARQDGVNLVCKYEVSTTAVQKEFVMAGLAKCILPLSAVHNDLGPRRLSATPIKGLALTRTLVWRSDRRQSASTLEVAEVIRKIILARRPKGAQIYV